jgi:hypothetical protein
VRSDGKVYDFMSNGFISVQNRGYIRMFWHYFKQFLGFDSELKVDLRLMENFSNEIFKTAFIDIQLEPKQLVIDEMDFVMKV